MKAQGLGASQIAKALKIGRASVYRVLEAGRSQRITSAGMPCRGIDLGEASVC
jgi:hypothetical protein